MPASATQKTPHLTVAAYRGDAKTLLAFNLPKRRTTRLAGFTIECRPQGAAPYYLLNSLQFKRPGDHAQDATEPPGSSINAPFHKFRWLHVPGSAHQGLKPVYGTYTYVVTPRYFDRKGSLRPLDRDLSVSVDVEVAPFASGSVALGFTRGYVQSQAFVNHFGLEARIRPDGDELLFDTSALAGANAAGERYTYADEYEWLGFTARERIVALLDEVRSDSSLRLDVFAYDLDEPDLLRILLELAPQGRVRVLLDDAALHHSKTKPKPEDRFEELFGAAAKAPAEIRRGHFGRYAHDKVLVVSDGTGPRTALTGSTNFSVSGLYVNSNHVVVFDDPDVAGAYGRLFDTVWEEHAHPAAFRKTDLSTQTFVAADLPSPTRITFAPHDDATAGEILDGIADRIAREGRRGRTTGSVLFAVMAIDSGTSPVYAALNALHADARIFSFGISDDPDGISLYEPGRKTGVLVTGKPVRTRLPPPFNQVPAIGLRHQIHHKFVVCGFNGPDPVVYCGSSNLALGGESRNGDNLLELHDPEIVNAFAIEALALVDHFQFLDRLSVPAAKPPPAAKQPAAVTAGWFLSTTDRWTRPYFDPDDLHYVDRRLFEA